MSSPLKFHNICGSVSDYLKVKQTDVRCVLKNEAILWLCSAKGNEMLSATPKYKTSKCYRITDS